MSSAKYYTCPKLQAEDLHVKSNALLLIAIRILKKNTVGLQPVMMKSENVCR